MKKFMKRILPYLAFMISVALTTMHTKSFEIGAPSMALLTAGFVYLKADRCRRGSIKALYLANLDDIAAAGFTLVAGEHVYNDVTMESLKVFFKWTFEPDKAFAKWEANENENGKDTYNTEVSIYEPRIADEILKAAAELAETCGMVAIAEFYDETDINGASQTVKVIFGYDEIDGKEVGVDAHVSGDSGETREAANGVTILLKGKQSEIPYLYDDQTNVIPV